MLNVKGKVSIIIPLYNASNYLKYSLSSTLSQSHKNLEIILIDDGSTDDTRSELLKYEDSRIIYLRKNNSGKNSALNLAVEYVTGDYVMFLDQDDFMPSYYVETMYNSIVDSSSDIVCSNVMDIWGIEKFNQLILKEKELLTNIANPAKILLDGKQNIYESYFFKNEIGQSLWNKIYPSHYFNGFCFNLEFQLDDRPNIYKILFNSEKILYLKEIFVFHLNHTDSMGHNKMFEPNYLKELIEVDLELLRFFSNVDFNNGFFKRLEHKINSEIKKNFIRIGVIDKESINMNYYNVLRSKNSNFISKLLLLLFGFYKFYKSKTLRKILIKILYRKFNYSHLL